MRVDIGKLFGKGYGTGLFLNPYMHPRYRAYYGARSTKKSTDIMGYEPILKIMEDPRRNIVFIRRNDTDNRQSTYANLQSACLNLGVLDQFKFTVNPLRVVFKPTGQQLVFRGFSNPTGIASIKFPVGTLTDVYFEEASEIESYDSFRKMDGTLRVPPEGITLQITLCLNPWDKNSWIYEKLVKGRLEDDYDYLDTHDYNDCYDPNFQLGFGKGLYLHQSTYKINEFRDPSYDEGMMYMREHMNEIYRVEGLGMWGNTTSKVYMEFTREKNVISPADVMDMRFARYAIGVDTGLSSEGGRKRSDGRFKSATTAELVGITGDCARLVSVDEFFDSNEGLVVAKPMNEIVAGMVRKIKSWRDQIYASHWDLMKGIIPVYIDCADKGFLDAFRIECRRQGIYNVEAVPSTKISIQTRVDFMRMLMGYQECLISSNCQNLIREIESSRRGVNGECRENLNDHALNAWEYGWTPLKAMLMRYRLFKVR